MTIIDLDCLLKRILCIYMIYILFIIIIGIKLLKNNPVTSPAVCKTWS